jgi:DNA-binding PadR family transcriptional regulator
VNPIIQALRDGGLVEKLDGSRLLERDNYRVTGAGHQACRDEIDLRRRELDAIDKDKDVRRWLSRSARR